MKSQTVPERLGLLERLADVVKFDANFEFTPASFGDREWLTVDSFDGWRIMLVYVLVEVDDVAEVEAENVLRRGLVIDSCSLNCTFFSQYVMSVSSTPFTNTVHEWV